MAETSWVETLQGIPWEFQPLKIKYLPRVQQKPTTYPERLSHGPLSLQEGTSENSPGRGGEMQMLRGRRGKS